MVRIETGKENRKILIVEDSRAQALAMASLLESKGLKVICASTAGEGFCLARKHLPDMVILDIFLPDMSGMKVCYILKQDPRTAHIPVVLLTAYPRQELRQEGVGTAGAIEFIPKDGLTEIVLLKLLHNLNMI